MPLTMVFGLFSIGFPMDFHAEGLRGIPYSSQSFPVASQRVLTPSETKVEDPQTKVFRGEKNSSFRGHSGTKQTAYRHLSSRNMRMGIESE